MKGSFLIRSALCFIDLLVYGNIVIGFGAFCMSEFFQKMLFDTSSLSLSSFLFCATVFTYHFHRRLGYALSNQNQPSAAIQWMLDHPFLSKSISILSFLLAIYFFTELSRSTLFVIIPISVLSLLYVQRLSDRKVLREVPFLKIFLIALVWAMAIVLLPASQQLDFSGQVILLTFAFFLFMIAEIIPFDIRDLENDQLDRIQTIPLSLSLQQSKQLSYILLLLSNLILFHEADPAFFLPFFLSSLFLLICIYFLKSKQNDYYFSLLIESSLILPWILMQIIPQNI
jgi:hypothetical protein